jgi:hypothetical protein
MIILPRTFACRLHSTPQGEGYQQSSMKRLAFAWCRAGAQLALLLCLGASYAAAQAAAEYGTSVAATGARTLAIPFPKVQIPPTPQGPQGLQGKTSSAHLTAPADRSLPVHAVSDTEAANRKALETGAGKDAAKLMLRSEPNRASVRIDGKPVGQTPLLLIVHPGVYKVEMEGLSTELGRRQVDLLPKETREVVLTLEPRYPTQVQLRWHTQ